jgi:DNA polymerase III alpha subunit (gram-positive type)
MLDMMYLGFDLETGGFEKANHTIMEAYFALWDESWNFVDELQLYLKKDDGTINGTDEAFKIIGIDPEQHLLNPNTVTYSEGREKLHEMLNKHKQPKKRSHYRFLGQNIMRFDIPFMEAQGFFTEADIKKAGISHNSLDTTCIVTWLKDINVLPDHVGSISSLIDYFELPKGTAHRAKDDVHMQKEIYVRLSNLLKKNAIENLKTSAVESDLLSIIEL